MKAASLAFVMLCTILYQAFALCALGENINPPERLKLLSRSSAVDYTLKIEESDKAWLREKRFLRIGFTYPDYPPFDSTTNTNEYEGITADYAGLIAGLLNVGIEAYGYKSRIDSLAALERGDIDLLGTSNLFEVSAASIILSAPYADDRPVLVTRVGETALTNDLSGLKLSMVYDYTSKESVEKTYPNAKIELYSSIIEAIGAVAFGQADAFLGDATSANYLINKSHLNNVQLASFSKLESQNFSFAVSNNNFRLKKLIDVALQTIPTSEKITILRRWGAAGLNIPGDQFIQFSESEQAWLEKNRQIKVVINKSFIPLTFFDENDKFKGIAADILRKISLKTGLEFDIHHAPSVEAMVKQLLSNEAQIIGALSPSNERADLISFTRPFVSSAYVLVTRNQTNKIKTLDNLAGKRLAVIRGNVLRPYLNREHPEIIIVDAESQENALELVSNGKADAAISSLIIARYQIALNYRDELSISSTIGSTPAQIAFATNYRSKELISILNKALLSIPPEEIDAITTRWRSDIVLNDSQWDEYRAIIIQGSLIVTIVFLLAFAWISYLRRLISRREIAERALRDQMEFMRSLFDGTPHPIYVRDRDGSLMLCNKAYLSITGFSLEAVIGKTTIESVLHDTNQAQKYHNDFLSVMASGEALIDDRALTLDDGTVCTIYHWILPYSDSNGKIIGMIGGWIDVSERFKLVEELKVAKAQADEANRAKTTFLATMSHEIRTPMNAVIGMLELALKKADRNIIDRTALDVASNAAHGLLDLIGDILDVARIESGRLSLNPERANLRGVVESVIRMLDGLARQKQIALILELKGDINYDVLMDPLRFKQILANLIGNAIKFTHEGEVRLIVECHVDEIAHQMKLFMMIADTGVGISESDLGNLFRPFSQASNNEESARNGSGLGLMISRTLCEMMGGNLVLASEINKGTVITISMSLQTLDMLPEPSYESKNILVTSANRLKILIVDDYPANRTLLSQQLVFLGHDVCEANDGAQGLQTWLKGSFNVVITDCNMPVMNGYSLAKTIRYNEEKSSREPCLILGFTANAQAEERERCFQAGMDDCLFKPISLDDLAQRLDSISSRTTTTSNGNITESLELSSLERITRGDREAIKKLLNELLRSTQDDLQRLNELEISADRAATTDLAHRIKGGARIIQLKPLIDACEQLEAACLGDSTESDYVLSIRELRQAMKWLIDEIGRTSP